MIALRYYCEMDGFVIVEYNMGGCQQEGNSHSQIHVGSIFTNKCLYLDNGTTCMLYQSITLNDLEGIFSCCKITVCGENTAYLVQIDHNVDPKRWTAMFTNSQSRSLR